MKLSRIYIAVIGIIALMLFFTSLTFAQRKDSTSQGDDQLNQMAEYSRPGKFHQLLADLTGSWTFEGSRFEWIDSVTSRVEMKLAGSLVRRPFADGRFFIAELATALKIQLPVKNGKFVEGYGEAIQTEGFDNVHKKFQISYINNHIGSDIAFWEGDYDSATRTISFYSKMELLPGMSVNIRFQFVFKDNDHYQWLYATEQNGKYYTDTEMNFTRTKKKPR